MFPKTGSSERQLSRSEVYEIFDEGTKGILSMEGREGYPCALSLNYVRIGENIYIYGAKEGLKLLLLDKNPKVCFTVIAQCDFVPYPFDDCFTKVTAFGTAGLPEGEEEKREVLNSLWSKYLEVPENMQQDSGMRSGEETAIYKIIVDRMTAKEEGCYGI